MNKNEQKRARQIRRRLRDKERSKARDGKRNIWSTDKHEEELFVKVEGLVYRDMEDYWRSHLGQKTRIMWDIEAWDKILKKQCSSYWWETYCKRPKYRSLRWKFKLPKCLYLEEPSCDDLDYF